MRKFSYLGLACMCGLLLMAAGCSCASTPSTVDITEPVILNVTSADGAVKGVVGVTPGEDKVRAVFMFHTTTDIPSNPGCAPDVPCVKSDNLTYSYVSKLVRDSATGGDGAFSALYCNQDVYPVDPFGEDPEYYGCDTDYTKPTNTFIGL